LNHGGSKATKEEERDNPAIPLSGELLWR